MIDKLSGLLERKTFLAKIDEEFRRAARYRRPFGFLMIDIAHNHFSQERDVRWSMGYSLLKQLAAVLKKCLRDIDVLGRYDGEIFAIALPETDLAGTRVAAERVRKAVEEHQFMGTTQDDRVQIAVNVGFASFPEHSQSLQGLVDSSTKALEIAKAEGGNKAVEGEAVEAEPEEPTKSESDEVEQAP